MISQLFADTRRFALRASIVVGAFALCAGLATAATTISTNMQTDGMLSVTSTSTFTGNIKAGDTVVTPYAQTYLNGTAKLDVTAVNLPAYGGSDNNTNNGVIRGVAEYTTALNGNSGGAPLSRASAHHQTLQNP